MQQDKRITLAAATSTGTAVAESIRSLPRPVRYTYTPVVFGYLVGEVIKAYTPEERAAFRIGFLAAFRDEMVYPDVLPASLIGAGE